VKILAVTTKERMPKMPDTPTVIEAGYPSLTCSFWDSLMVPAGTPEDAIERLNDALNAATEDPEIRARMENESLLALSGAPGAVTETINRDLELWGGIIEQEGIELN
jgi:tripartite-type tricarboxylate transporter receptor subunit TctC